MFTIWGGVAWYDKTDSATWRKTGQEYEKTEALRKS